jgi:hypothetical protein
VQVLDSRRLGAAWTLDRIWERLGIGAAIRRVAAGRRLDGDAVERVVFALVARRACEPGSKPAATGWVAQRVAIAGCPGFSDDAAYAAMDFLLDALGEIAAEVFGSVALWVPRTLSHHATCTYSCMRPPSRFRRSGRMAAPEGGAVAPAGGC